jgi:hypothetical protein
MTEAMRSICVTAVSLLSLCAFAEEGGEARTVAVAYLNALTGTGDDSGKALLLGGVTTTAQLFTLDNWEFASMDPVRREQGDLAQAQRAVRELDAAGRASFMKLLGGEPVGDDLKVVEVSEADAARALAPARAQEARLLKQHPVLAYALRVAKKEAFWHPKNAMRNVLAKADGVGQYSLEVHRWMVLSREGPGKTPRRGPLRVLRFKTEKLDTGYKVLPATDWRGE